MMKEEAGVSVVTRVQKGVYPIYRLLSLAHGKSLYYDINGLWQGHQNGPTIDNHLW